MSSLKELIAAGDHRLDPMLASITDAARQLAGASGAALAMWKDGAMVCRARSGGPAPPLGAQLSAVSGISGECLRTGKMQHCADTENDPLVDADVCRALGVRSIAVLPIQGWRGINGVLEVFSTSPAAFTEQDILLLQQLAALAERARASQPHNASSATRKLPSVMEKPRSSGLLPASDRVGDVVLAFLGARSRPLVLGGIGIVAISLLALVIWLGWRGPEDAEGKAQAKTPPLGATTINAETINAVTARRPGKRPLDNDPIWKANPGGEPMVPFAGKTSAGTPVRFARKVEVVSGNKSQAERSHGDRSLLLADAAASAAVPHVVANSQSDSEIGPEAGSNSDPRSDETASAEPPSISAGSTNQSALNGVLSAKTALSGPSAPVSQGISGGQLVHRVAPVYPAEARQFHLEGTVTLAAMVMEDGTVRDVKVVEGSSVLAQSAVDAVKHWRYKPYEVDGKPVKNEIKINIDFKFPELLSH